MTNGNVNVAEKGPVIFTENLSAFWGRSPVFSDINFSINEGELMCLCGPNGCGKSTLLCTLAGIKKDGLKTKGNIFFNGKNLKRISSKERARLISILFQSENSVWNFSVEDVVLSGRNPWKNGAFFYSDEEKDSAHEIMKSLGIEKLSSKGVFEISGGEWQKVRIARSLVQESKVILLDESTANLDQGYETEVLDFLKNLVQTKRKTVLLSIHDLNTASRFADRICLFSKEGSLHTGTPENMINSKLLEEVYGYSFNVYTHPDLKIKQVWS